MDKLWDCATNYLNLLKIQYNMTIGRKGKLICLSIQFEKIDFHHLAGLHKLTDIEILRSGKRERIFDLIINGTIKHEQIEKSAFFYKMERRIDPLSNLEQILDSNNIIFKFDPKFSSFSLIKAQYLIKSDYNENDTYLFIDQKKGNGGYFCKTFFPKDHMDYTRGQTSYTLLYKEKVDLSSGTTCVQYDRLTPKH